MSHGPNIQWFPGHMAKTRRMMWENLKKVDIVVELRDARIPLSSANPEIESLIKKKPRLLLLTKPDLADPQVTALWQDYFKQKKIPAVVVDTRTGKGLDQLLPMCRTLLKDVLDRREEKGMTGRLIRMMVVGIPNVGKSSFINRMAGGKPLVVANRPGVTLRKQWIRVEGDAELLDMPGVLWPRFEDKAVGENLAFTGAIKDDIMDLEWIAMLLLAKLKVNYPKGLLNRYSFTQEDLDELDDFALLELLGRKRGMLQTGGVVDTERAASTFLDEFRAGTLGRITLEVPPKAPAKGAQA